jgi:hypothetical protein
MSNASGWRFAADTKPGDLVLITSLTRFMAAAALLWRISILEVPLGVGSGEDEQPDSDLVRRYAL